MMKLMLLTLTLVGFEIQDNLANYFPIKDCQDGNKCIVDSQCGQDGKCTNRPLTGIYLPG